jgi:hypothetical protein
MSELWWAGSQFAGNVIGLGDRLRNEACAKPVLGGEANS